MNEATLEAGRALGALTALGLAAWVTGTAEAQGPAFPTTGKGLYEVGCAKCHGEDGRGGDLTTLGFNEPLPDFSDCRFASREPDADWIAVAHEGGPVRSFSRTMPAFGGAFSVEQLQMIMEHIRGFCADRRWPRGELNLPRALVTEKAFPEDEAVYTVGVNADGQGAVTNRITYERRFGPTSMWEIVVPFGAREVSAEDGWGNVGIGDVVLVVKHTIQHSIESGSIVSVGGELTLPTGSETQGRGTGTTRFEPFVAYGQILPGSLFLQAVGAVELSADTSKAEHEAVLRTVLGGTWNQGGFGRSWSPMVEVLGALPLTDRSKLEWSIVPQVQVSLSRRQHILANLGVNVPLNETERRSTQVLFYVLWDWFDGGLLQGW